MFQGNLFARMEVEESYSAPTYSNINESESFAPTFVSLRQQELMATHPLAFMFKGKNLDEVNNIASGYSKNFTKLPKTLLNDVKQKEWWELVQSFQTASAEIEYKKVDERFVSIQKGAFSIVDENNTSFEINYTYNPFYFDKSSDRTSFPCHHLEFRSEDANPISSSGYRSHFFQFVPFDAVLSLTDFIVQMLRVQLNITETILIDGEIYPAVPKPLKLTKKQTAKSCPNCQEVEHYSIEDGCDECGYSNDDVENADDDFEIE